MTRVFYLLSVVIKGFSLRSYSAALAVSDHGWWSGEFHNKWRGFSHTKKKMRNLGHLDKLETS
eukprot:COSAG01_NODE_2386_length_7787_cov_13.747789_4_plen_63_part_00